MAKPFVAVIVPACNEEMIIAKCLRALSRQTFEGMIEVVVVINGSVDRTAKVVADQRSHIEARGWKLNILELRSASKTAALNAGDAVVDPDIRIYLDADAILSRNAVEALAEALAGRQPRLAAPQLHLAQGDGILSRICGAVWIGLPPISDDVVGGGCYAVNRAGRARFGEFPNVIADDGFVRAHYNRSERVLVRSANCKIPFPDDEKLVKVFGRWLHGNLELVEMGLVADDKHLLLRRLRALAVSPSLWLGFPIFLFARFRARRVAYRQFRAQDGRWDRARAHTDGGAN